MAAPPPAPAPDSPAAGPPAAAAAQFPGFKLLENLRQTRSCHWFRARQLRLGREVLIKVALLGDLRSQQILEAEIRLCGRVRHPGLLTLIDFKAVAAGESAERAGPAPPLSYAIYDFPSGRSLEEAVEGLSGPQAVQVFGQLAELFLALHGQGIHLRQVLPRDLFLDEHGRLRLASLEAAEACGVPARELSPLWLAPGEAGKAGDYFLLGLHLLFLISNRVPIPPSVEEQPEKWLEIAGRCLRLESGRAPPAPAAPLLKLLGLLLAAPRLKSAPKLAEIDRALGSWVGQQRRKAGGRSSGRSRRFQALALLAAAAAAAAIIALALARKPAEVRPPLLAPTAASPPPRSAPPPEPSIREEKPAAAERNGGTAEATASSSVPTQPPSTAPAVEKPAAEAKKITGAEPRLAPTPEPVPSPLERFLARASLIAKSGAAAPLADLEALWKDGTPLAERIAKGAEGGSAEVLGSPAEAKAFWEALLEIKGWMEEKQIRGSLFQGEARFEEGEGFSVKYDFSTRLQLQDWEASGDASRVSIFNNRLVVLGEVLFRPGRFLKEKVQVKIKVAAGGRPAERPNLNLLLWRPPEDQIAVTGKERFPDPALFGLGSFWGEGYFSAADSRNVLLPANCLATVAGAHPAAVVWHDASEQALARARTAGEVEVEWDPDGWRWKVDGAPVIAGEAAAKAAEALAPLAGRRGTFGLETFQSQLELEEAAVSGRLDAEEIRNASLRLAESRLKKDFPQIYGAGEAAPPASSPNSTPR